jgi:hypothetical protein
MASPKNGVVPAWIDQIKTLVRMIRVQYRIAAFQQMHHPGSVTFFIRTVARSTQFRVEHALPARVLRLAGNVNAIPSVVLPCMMHRPLNGASMALLWPLCDDIRTRRGVAPRCGTSMQAAHYLRRNRDHAELRQYCKHLPTRRSRQNGGPLQ